MNLDDANQKPEIRIVNRFYMVFLVFGLLLLLVGVPFVFVRKLVAAVCVLFLLASIVTAWYFSRKGYPERSLAIFSGFIWVLMVGLLYAGLSTNGAAVALAVSLMVSVVVSHRAGMFFAGAYFLAWFLYTVLGFYGMAPAPYFTNAPFTGWIVAAGACWLLLIPVPELIKGMHQGAALQRSVFEATSDALLVVDLSGKTESCNQRFIDMWGIPPELISTRDDSAMLAFVMSKVDAPDAFRRGVGEIYANPMETSFDTLLFKDGRVIERYSQPNSVGAQVVGRVWSFRDVTAGHRSQNELRSSQVKFQGLFELSPLGMARNSMDGKFYEANTAFSRLFGYPKDELKSMSYWDITPPHYAAQDAVHLESLRTRGIYGPFEKEYIHKSGHTIPVRLNGMLIRGTDGQPYIWSIIEDISEQKAHERMLTDARKAAEDAAIAKGEFLANMSHEIRTPMNAILGMLTLLGNTPLNTNQFDYVNKTEGAAKSLLSLLNDILDLAKIDSRKMELDAQPFLVEQLMRDLSVVLSANVGSKNIDVLYDIDPRIPPQLVGDAPRLQQALINLGGNAVKFTSSGQVVVGLRLHEAAAPELHHVQLEFWVEDSGIGIAPENHARIFTEFSQAESTTTRRFGGSGLGLAISKRIIELMGGSLALRSELGKGSRFSFSLCLSTVPDATPPALPAMPQTVLVVDNNAVAAELTATMLRVWGWTVDIAGSGQAARDMVLAKAQNKLFPYDCVYLDWQMPHMDGWECLNQLQALGLSAAAPGPGFVMLSANGKDNLSQRTQQEQGLLSGFLVKPVTALMLLEASQSPLTTTDTTRQASRSSKRQLAGMRILVVDDNAINQQVAEELLGFEGALVSIAADGKQGAHAVASATVPFDAVLMDVQMPVMDGYAATRVIRQELGLAALPIIGLTANAMPADRESCLRAGMDEHVGKPFDMAHLVPLLIRLTGRQPDTETQRTASVTIAGGPGPLQDQPDAPPVALPDIDIDTALTRMGSMHDVYVAIARQFQEMLSTLAAELEQQLVHGGVKEARILLHTFKGNAATLGLDRLSAALGEMEKMCIARNSLDPIQQGKPALEPVIASAQTALQQAIDSLAARS
ncbi:MAG: response regulator [Pseudomonadota bacterium]